MISVFAYSAIDRVFESRSGKTNNSNFIFTASTPSMKL